MRTLLIIALCSPCYADAEFDALIRRAAEIRRATEKVQDIDRLPDGKRADLGVAGSDTFTVLAPPGSGLARLACDIATAEWGPTDIDGRVCSISVRIGEKENVDLRLFARPAPHSLWITGPAERLPTLVRDAVRALKERTTTQPEQP